MHVIIHQVVIPDISAESVEHADLLDHILLVVIVAEFSTRATIE